MARSPRRTRSLQKVPTGIVGLDELTSGGLPYKRPTLLCGGAGCGKTLLAMEFLVNGARRYGEPGVFVSFEESADDLFRNFASLGFDLPGLVATRKLVVDHARVEPHEVADSGDYDLDGLFIRLAHAIDQVGAKRVVLDTVEALFAGLPNPTILRAELRRLFRWLKQRGVTAVITAEQGSQTLTRHGIEEYVSDCVIMLDHRVADRVSTRRLRVVKYRGSVHGTNEYPFLIDDDGIWLLPVTSLKLEHAVSDDRVSSGIPSLDTMLDGRGYYRGSSILLSGTAGSGKTSVAAHFATAAARRGERCLYFAFEESPAQLMRNMRSIGLDMARWTQKGLLQFHAARPSLHGLELHLSVMLKAVQQFRPRVVIVDPITSLAAVGNQLDTKTMLLRLVDSLKAHGITALLTSLTHAGTDLEHTEAEISSLMDTWLLLRDIETQGERNRGMYVLKARGMAHSNQIREFRLTAHGVELSDVYVGPGVVLTGSARVAQEARDEAERRAAREQLEQQRFALEQKRQALENQIATLRTAFAAEEARALQFMAQSELHSRLIEEERAIQRRRRQPDAARAGARRRATRTSEPRP